jgi:alpha-galactosidase
MKSSELEKELALYCYSREALLQGIQHKLKEPDPDHITWNLVSASVEDRLLQMIWLIQKIAFVMGKMTAESNARKPLGIRT